MRLCFMTTAREIKTSQTFKGKGGKQKLICATHGSTLKMTQVEKLITSPFDSDDNLIAFDSTKLHMASGGIERDGLSR